MRLIGWEWNGNGSWGYLNGRVGWIFGNDWNARISRGVCGDICTLGFVGNLLDWTGWSSGLSKRRNCIVLHKRLLGLLFLSCSALFA